MKIDHRILLSARAATITLVLMLAACDSGSSLTAKDYLKRAENHWANNELNAAVIELKNAIKADPNDGDVRLLLGRTYLVLSNFSGAEKELLRSRDLGVAASRYSQPLARVWLLTGQFDRVLEEFDAGQAKEMPLRLDLLVARGNAHRGLGHLAEAERHFAEALAINPDHVRALASMGALALQQGDLARAEETLARAHEAAPDDIDVISLQGDLRFAQGRYSEAEESYRAFAELRPTLLKPRLLLAQAQIAGGRIDEGLRTINQIGGQAGRTPAANYLRALAAYQKQDYLAASRHAEAVLAEAPQHFQSMLLAGAAHFALNHNEQAYRYLDMVVARTPRNLAARRILGATLIRLERADEAVKLLEPLAEASPDDRELLALVGSAAIRSGDLETGKVYFERIKSLDPADPVARAQLGAIRISLGETEQGLLELEKAVEQDPKFDRAHLAIALSHIRNRDFDKALEAAARLSENHPDSPLGLTVTGIAHFAKGDKEAAEAAFTQALELQPGSPAASANLAALALQDGRTDKALTLLRAAAAANPDHVPTLRQLGQLEVGLGEFDVGTSRFLRIIELMPDSVEPRVFLSRIYIDNGQPDKALKVADAAFALNPKHAGLLEALGLARLAAGRPADAAIAFRSLVAEVPQSARAHLLLALAYRNLGENDKQEKSILKALELEPANLQAMTTLGLLRLRQGDRESVRDIIAKIRPGNAERLEVLDLEASLAMSEGRHGEAVELYKKAVAQASNSELVMKLATAQRLAGDSAASRATISERLRGVPSDVNARSYLAGLELADKNLTAARDHYLAVIDAQPENVPALNNLAWILLELGGANGALRYAERALQLRSDDPRVMDTTAMVYLKLDRGSEATALLKRALEKLPGNPELRFHLAQALARTGERREAREILETLSGESFDEQEAAKRLLSELGG